MRSEAEIRRRVETRLHRWAMLALDSILWVGAAKLIRVYSLYDPFHDGLATLVALVMFGWLVFLVLHGFRTVYIKFREWLVKRAIERECQAYEAQNTDRKRKRDESASLPDEMLFSLPAEDGEYSVVPFRHEAEDGELVDFPFRDNRDDADVKANNDER